jgi:hypothetical protein
LLLMLAGCSSSGNGPTAVDGPTDDPSYVPCASASTPGYAGAVTSGAGPRPPNHVIAVQGPTDPAFAYALVSWDRSDPSATGYEVLRDGAVIARLAVDGDAWDDTCFQDLRPPAGTHAYAVRAVAGEVGGEPSPAFTLRVRGDADFGAVYDVDSFAGADDSARIAAALAAAEAAGGGVVRFGPRTYRLREGIVVTGDDIVLRGAGPDRTFLQPTYAGVGGDSACSGTERIVDLRGTTTELGALLAAPIARGDRTATVTSAAGLAVGQIVLLDESHDELEPSEFEALGVPQDPGTGNDLRYAYESNEIVALDGTTVTFKLPFSYPFSVAAPWRRYERGLRDGVELLTIQGRSEDEQTWYDGLTLRGADAFAAAVQVRWTNRRLAELSGHAVRLVGFHGPYGGPRGAEDGSCRYKVQIYKSTNALVVGAVLGHSEHDVNRSLITIQQTVRTVVRNSLFQRSRSYGVNEHGEGSPHLLIENNRFVCGASSPYAIDFGNTTWGFSGPAIVRNNSFEGHQRDLQIAENSYEIRVLDNVARGNSLVFLRAYAWAGPDTDPTLHGSMRMTVARNVVSGSMGMYLGPPDGFYPYTGMRDMVIRDNVFDVAEEAIHFFGDSTQTNRIQVSGNGGTAEYDKPELVAGDYWADNGDGESFGAPTDVPWTAETFAWEAYDRN